MTSVRKKEWSLLATIRVDSPDQQRVQVKVRTAEGQAGMITVLVIPHGESVCVPLEIPIKSLSLHERVSSIGS